MRSSRVFTLLLLLAISSPDESVAQEVEDGFFSSDGVRIHYTVDGAGPPVVLLHGFAVDSELNWRATGILPGLSEAFRVIALDLRGHGQSDKPHDPSAYGAKMVEDVLNLLDHLGIERAHVIGYSMGSTLALNLAVNHPDRVLSLAVGGSGWIRPETVWVERLRRRAEALEDIEPGQSITPILLPPGASEPPPEFRAKVEANDPQALAAVSRQLPELWILEAELRASQVPTLAFIGDGDELLPTVEAMVGVKPNLEVKVLPDRDHLSVASDPELVPMMREFLLSGAMEVRDEPAPPARSTAAADSAEAVAAIEAVLDDWLEAYEQAKADVIADLFVEDGMYAANTGQLLRGRTAIEGGVRGWIAIRPQFFARFGLDPDSRLEVDREVLRFRTLGEGAYSLLRFIVRVEPSGCVMDVGHALAIWRRDNGEWRMESLVVNQDREPPENACARRQPNAMGGVGQGSIARQDPRSGVLRTPEERFRDLPDYPFQPHYATVDGLRIHYVDEGPRDAIPVVLLHGEPSWSFLYRKMIPILAADGHRVIAPDLVGFGKSDKPVDPAAYTYQRHVDWMRVLLFDELRLEGITLFGQDWGGLIGLRLVAEHPDRFAAVVAANTGLPTGEGEMSEAFWQWRRFSQEVPELPIGWILQQATVTELTPEVIAAYEAPFPDERYKAGGRAFPMLVPVSPDDPAAPANRAAWEVLFRWEKPFLTLFSDSDPITAGGDRVLQSRIPGARGQPHRTIEGAGHFLQEDKGEEIARLVNEFIARNEDPIRAGSGARRILRGDTVRVVRFQVKPDEREQFERFFWESLRPAAAKRQGVPVEDLDLGGFRLLIPVEPNPQGFLTYYVLVDPAGGSLGAGEVMRDMVRDAFPGEEGRERVRRWMESIVLSEPFTPVGEDFTDADLRAPGPPR